MLHDPAYREANAGALRMEWPRIPLPGWPELSVSPAAFLRHSGSENRNPGSAASRARGLDTGVRRYDGGEGLRRNPVFRPGAARPAEDSLAEEAAQTLAASAARGRELAALLDPDTPVPGVTTGQLRPEIAAIAVPATTHGRNMTGDDFALTAGWGHYGAGEAVMPGQGRAVERAYTPDERDALGAAIPDTPARAASGGGPMKGRVGAGFKPAPTQSVQGAPWDHGGTHALANESWVKPGMTDGGAVLGDTTFDIYLNDHAYWRNVPAAVWRYKLGGYQVLKKWLSYRERNILGRPLRLEEVEHFTDTARRIGAILLAVAR